MASTASSTLAPSAHVALLQHYQQTGEESVTHHELPLAASPSPSPSPQPRSLDAAAATLINTLLPLPSGWSTLRAKLCTLEPEQRSIPSLQLDGGKDCDKHVLRRGLWAVCACMYLPDVLEGRVVARHHCNGLSMDAVRVAPPSAATPVAASCPPDCPGDVELEPVSELRVPSRFQVSVVEGGITNLLYKCTLAPLPSDDPHSSLPLPPPVLVRIYGPRTELVINRSLENEVVDVLSRSGEGPTIWGRFHNGRMEGWMEGRSISPIEMRSTPIAALIAERLAILHHQPMPFPRKSAIFTVLRKWATLAKGIAFGGEDEKNVAKQRQLDELQLKERVLPALGQYLTALDASPFGSASPLTFCHNDLLSGNVMFHQHEREPEEEEGSNAVSNGAVDTPTSDLKSMGSVRLVDFEYANFNPRAFDLANHFCECCGFECDWEQFPSPAAQMHFIRHYLATSNTYSHTLPTSSSSSSFQPSSTATQPPLPPSSIPLSACHTLFAEVQCWLLAPHLFWCLWAVVQARYSPISFDYMTYALERWRGYQRMREECFRWLNKTKEEVEGMKEINDK